MKQAWVTVRCHPLSLAMTAYLAAELNSTQEVLCAALVELLLRCPPAAQRLRDT